MVMTLRELGNGPRKSKIPSVRRTSPLKKYRNRSLKFMRMQKLKVEKGNSILKKNCMKLDYIIKICWEIPNSKV